MRSLLSIEARNFRTLRRVNVELGNLNVLVGPNEAGKSNFLDLIEFLGDSARDDLPSALRRRGGYDRVRFRGSEAAGAVVIKVSANVTSHSSENAPDEYELSFWSRQIRNSPDHILMRREEFLFKRTRGRGRRIAVKGNKAEFIDTGKDSSQKPSERLSLRGDSLALSTLQRLPPNEGGAEIERFAGLFTSFRVFNVDVAKAVEPSRLGDAALASDAANLASAIAALAEDSDAFTDFENDAKVMIPNLLKVELVEVGVSAPAVSVRLRERGLSDSTFLEDASFGTIRILSLLALLYDPSPPRLTCIEEIDHGLHPYLFDLLVERLREASTRTQILVATHSPALVNRLRPEELIVVEREDDGSTRLPAISQHQLMQKYAATNGGLELGELWFSGTLGGVPRE